MALRDHPRTLWGLLTLPGIGFLFLWLVGGNDSMGPSGTSFGLLAALQVLRLLKTQRPKET